LMRAATSAGIVVWAMLVSFIGHKGHHYGLSGTVKSRTKAIVIAFM
jgi:hypothetical protein